MRLFLPTLIMCFFALSSFSQKILRLDTPKKSSKAVYYIGMPIIFKLESNKDNTIWYQERIVDFDTEKGIIYFESWKVHFKDITAVRNPYARKFLRSSAVMLKGFGLGLIFFSTAGRLTKDCPNCNEALVAGASSAAVGWLLGKLAGPKTYKIGRNKLYLLDLTLKPTTVDKV